LRSLKRRAKNNARLHSKHGNASGRKLRKVWHQYHVKFNESEETFQLWFKKQPEQGQVIRGEIKDGKFTKEKKQWNGSSESGQPYKKPYGAVEADKADGQRQGMCFNNAAAQVASLQSIQGKVLAPDVWANAVHEYAQALYATGNLKAPETTEEGLPIIDVTDKDAPSSVQELFGVQK
jgi:hypothetical protein